MKKILAIPAAGKGSRLGKDGVPKIFSELAKGVSIIDAIFEEGFTHLDEVILLLSPSGKDFFQHHPLANEPKIKVIIQSEPNGMLGAMDLIFKEVLRSAEDFQMLVQWGDQPFCGKALHDSLFNDLSDFPCALPLVWVSNPYVQFKFSDKLRVIETREGEKSDAYGWKDMGIFAFRKSIIELLWEGFKNKAPRGKITGEQNFVKFFELIQEKYKIKWALDQPNFRSIGINTPEDLLEAQSIYSQQKLIQK